MRNESDKKNLVLVDDDSVNGFTRWLPTIIVFCVVGGFFSLSWYAYHAGMESVKDEDLLVVEADKTPMKEKPADPGGMQFPNQDKTIFDTFSGNKAVTQKVERILPAPEEPMSKDMDMSETTTWINNKIADKPATPKEQIIGKPKEEKKPQNQAEHQVIPVSSPDDVSESFVAARTDMAKPDQALDNAVKNTDTKKITDPKVIAAETDKLAQKALKETEEKAAKEKALAMKAAEEKKMAQKEQADAEAIAKKAEAKAAPTGSASVQLGAYRSDQEAREAWDKMHLKFKNLSDKEPAIIRADLGDKGIYFRLRINGLSSTAEANSLCQSLASKGQPCILSQGK